MDLLKFIRVNEIFNFTFDIRAHQTLKKLLDIRIYEQM